MEEFDYIPENFKSQQKPNIIKVIGVGGGGCNAVAHMYRGGIQNVDFLVCNTDLHSLENNPVPEKLPIGVLGAGCNPDVARNAALEHIDMIEQKLKGSTEMVFIAAGMGGGTGTGATPIIAQKAREMGLLTVGVVTFPFRDEGNSHLVRASEGIKELEQYVDSLLIIDNQKIYDIYEDLPVSEAFSRVDEVLNTAVKGIAEIITGIGYVNVDFADVKTTMKDSEMAIMGVGVGTGDNRDLDAIQQALNSPLLNNIDLTTAKKVLINISTGKTHGLITSEQSRIMGYIQDALPNVTQSKKGIVFDDSLGEDLKVTIVAAGIKRAALPIINTHIKKTDTVTLNTSKDIDIPYSSGVIDLSFGESEIITGDDYISPYSSSKGSDSMTYEIPVYKTGEPIANFENEPAIIRKKKILSQQS